jgi:hypothetical protein
LFEEVLETSPNILLLLALRVLVPASSAFIESLEDLLGVLLPIRRHQVFLVEASYVKFVLLV